ncbi:hypothetical protein [Segniliparus rotundus]|nr:hypothetical protein [Segniliparus rotundus]
MERTPASKPEDGQRSPLATPAEVAAYRRTTLGQLAQERYKKRGCPYKKIGSRVFYDWQDVYAFVDQCGKQTALAGESGAL